MADTEIWRTIPNSPQHEVSNLGRVRSYIGSSYRLNGEPRILKGTLTAKGYHTVRLSNHRKCYTHRLVLEAFIGPCPLGCEANHKSTVKSDNAIDNLQWITHSENVRHALHSKHLRDRMATNIKLRKEDIPLIRQMAAKDIPQILIADQFGVTVSTISYAVRHKTWKHIQ